MSKVKNPTIGEPVPLKIQLAENIIGKMTGNTNFTKPKPTLPEINAALGKLAESYDAAIDGGKTKKLQMHTDEEKVDALMAQLAVYVQDASEGDALIISSSGFEVSKNPSPVGPLPGAANMRANPGTEEGTIKLQFGKVKGSKSYNIQRTLDPNTPSTWTTILSSTSTRVTLTSQDSGKKTWYRAIAIGSAGPGSPSDPAWVMVP
jgi:hypothetical protein